MHCFGLVAHCDSVVLHGTVELTTTAKGGLAIDCKYLQYIQAVLTTFGSVHMTTDRKADCSQ